MKVDWNLWHWIGGVVIMFAVMFWIGTMPAIGATSLWKLIISAVVGVFCCFMIGYLWDVIQKKLKFGNANMPDVMRVVKGGLYIGLPLYLIFCVVRILLLR